MTHPLSVRNKNAQKVVWGEIAYGMGGLIRLTITPGYWGASYLCPPGYWGEKLGYQHLFGR